MFIGIGIGLTGLARQAPFSPTSLFTNDEAGGWWDASDLTTLFQDSAGTTPVTADGDPVGMWQDKSGNGNHLVQETADARPLYKTSGGLHWIESDGTNDFLNDTFDLVQPWQRVSAILQLTYVTANRIFGGGTNLTGIFRQLDSAGQPFLALYDGTSATTTIPSALDTDQVFTELHSGSASYLQANAGTPSVVNPGTNPATGVSVFSERAANYGSMRNYGFIMRAGTMSAGQLAQTRSYFAAKAGVAL